MNKNKDLLIGRIVLINTKNNLTLSINRDKKYGIIVSVSDITDNFEFVCINSYSFNSQKEIILHGYLNDKTCYVSLQKFTTNINNIIDDFGSLKEEDKNKLFAELNYY